jgi:hypothetical protein
MADRTMPDVDPPTSEAMVRLLDAMAREWPSFVDGLARLGEAISGRALGGGGEKQMRDLQAFDTLGQLAQAHGALLANIARQLADDGALREIHSSIARIPFEDVRQRLEEALNGAKSKVAGEIAQTTTPDEEGAVSWL